MNCQARLANPTCPGKREQTRLRQHGPDGGELAAASDEARQLGWQVASYYACRWLRHFAAPYHAAQTCSTTW